MHERVDTTKGRLIGVKGSGLWGGLGGVGGQQGEGKNTREACHVKFVSPWSAAAGAQEW